MTVQTLEQVITAWYTDDARGSHLDFDDVPALVKRLEAFGQPTGDTVQVPVSLIERAARYADLVYPGVDHDTEIVRDLRALLSQPTPTTEATWDGRITASRPLDLVDRDYEAWEEAEAARRSIEPAPGMQVEDRRGRVGEVVSVRAYANSATVDFGAHRHSVVRLDWLTVINPSTIRDLTSPAVTA